LDFETFVAHDGGTVNKFVSDMSNCNVLVAWGNIPSSLLSLFRSGGELELDAVDTVHAVNEKNQDKDEGNLHPILNLRNDGVLGDEAVGFVSLKPRDKRRP
jgi:hypothetical protein